MAITNPLSTLLLLLLLLPFLLADRALSLTSSAAAEFLNSHNAVRARLRLPPLQWSSELENFARSYANQRRGDCALAHSPGDLGENLFWGKGKQWNIADAVAAWAAEQGSYNYQSNTCEANADCTHYTQMVWRTTKRLGCAKVICRSGDTLVVCEYDPHGNIIGQRPY